MKKNIIIILLIACGCSCMESCKKNVDDFEFSGTVIGVRDCTSTTMSVSELDWGYVVEVSTPEGVGADYFDEQSQKHSNVVVLYGTRARLSDKEKISGKMYLDDKYSRAYCNYHYNDGVPEAVCSKLD